MRTCRDGGTCHHSCEFSDTQACFREECFVPLTVANMHDNWSTKNRMVLRYRGWVVKIFNLARNYRYWPAEWRLVRGIEVVSCPTSFRTFEGALRDALGSVDSIIEHENAVRENPTFYRKLPRGI